jgi:hypothetical protein
VSRDSSTLFFNPGTRWGGWSTPRPGRFTPGKDTRYPLYRRLGGPQGRSGRLLKISPPPGFDPRTVQPVASRYTDYAIPAHEDNKILIKYLKTEFNLYYTQVFQSKEWVCSRSLFGIVGSNPAGGMNACLLFVLYVVR